MFFTKKMEPEGQQFGRTEWYFIVHDIETNQFFCCIKPGTATNEQNREKQNST